MPSLATAKSHARPSPRDSAWTAAAQSAKLPLWLVAPPGSHPATKKVSYLTFDTENGVTAPQSFSSFGQSPE